MQNTFFNELPVDMQKAIISEVSNDFCYGDSYKRVNKFWHNTISSLQVDKAIQYLMPINSHTQQIIARHRSNNPDNPQNLFDSILNEIMNFLKQSVNINHALFHGYTYPDDPNPSDELLSELLLCYYTEDFFDIKYNEEYKVIFENFIAIIIKAIQPLYNCDSNIIRPYAPILFALLMRAHHKDEPFNFTMAYYRRQHISKKYHGINLLGFFATIDCQLGLEFLLNPFIIKNLQNGKDDWQLEVALYCSLMAGNVDCMMFLIKHGALLEDCALTLLINDFASENHDHNLKSVETFKTFLEFQPKIYLLKAFECVLKNRFNNWYPYDDDDLEYLIIYNSKINIIENLMHNVINSYEDKNSKKLSRKLEDNFSEKNKKSKTEDVEEEMPIFRNTL